MTEWPAAYEEWRATRDTLHMYALIVGKPRFALSPFEPQWGNVPLLRDGARLDRVAYAGRRASS